MHAQVNRSQVCRTGLCLLSIGLYIFSNASPNVSLVGHAEREDEIVVTDAVENRGWRRTAGGDPLTSGRQPGGHGWIVISPIVAQNSSRLPILCLRHLQILIRYINLLFQRIELRILK